MKILITKCGLWVDRERVERAQKALKETLERVTGTTVIIDNTVREIERIDGYDFIVAVWHGDVERVLVSNVRLDRRTVFAEIGAVRELIEGAEVRANRLTRRASEGDIPLSINFERRPYFGRANPAAMSLREAMR